MSFTEAVGNIRLHSRVVDLPQHCLPKVKGLVIGVSLYRRFELLLSLTQQMLITKNIFNHYDLLAAGFLFIRKYRTMKP